MIVDGGRIYHRDRSILPRDMNERCPTPATIEQSIVDPGAFTILFVVIFAWGLKLDLTEPGSPPVLCIVAWPVVRVRIT